MKRRIKTVVAITTLAVTASASINAEACDRGGRRISISRGPIGLSVSPFNRYPQPTYSQPVYPQTSYSQAGYAQPTFSQPTFSQPGYSQPGYPQTQVGYQQPVQPLSGSQVATVPGQRNVPIQSNVSGQSNVLPQSNMPGQRNMQGQPFANPSMASGQPMAGNQVRGNNPQASMAPQQSRTVAPQQAANTGPRTMANNRAASNPAGNANTSPAAKPPAASSQADAEASALQMLASIIATNEENTTPETTTAATTPQIPAFATTDAVEEPGYVGIWNVNLPGDQSVALELNADGSFVWTATKNGKSSNFQGQYRLENGRLTLVRSNDLQQMAGSWTVSGEGFTFKLDGATTGGLDFKRS